MDGLFEQCYSKSTNKKKSLPEGQSLSRESMKRLGVCSMVIEPHVFEITLYAVLSKPTTVLTSAGQFQVHEPVQPLIRLPRPTNGGSVDSADPPTNFHIHHQQQPSFTHSPPIVPAPQQPLAPQVPQVHRPSQDNSGSQQKAVKTTLPNIEHDKTGQVSQQPATPSRPPIIPEGPTVANGGESSNTNVGTPKPDPSTNADPVIQMLAARAATDNELKALMKIVAQGHATQPQLRVFQNHIDELNAIIKSQAKPAQVTSSGEAPKPLQPSSETNAAPSFQGPGPSAIPQAWHHAPAPASKQEPLSQYYSQPPQCIKPKAPKVPKVAAAAKLETNGIAFEWNNSNSDRYLIPRNSMVEYLAGGTEVLVSFLVTRDGSQAAGGNYKAGVEYWERVTIRIRSSQPKILEPLRKGVSHPEEVMEFMANIITRGAPAPDDHLIIRLPRPVEGEEKEKDNLNTESDEDVPKASYDAPNSLAPFNMLR